MLIRRGRYYINFENVNYLTVDRDKLRIVFHFVFGDHIHFNFHSPKELKSFVDELEQKYAIETH